MENKIRQKNCQVYLSYSELVKYSISSNSEMENAKASENYKRSERKYYIPPSRKYPNTQGGFSEDVDGINFKTTRFRHHNDTYHHERTINKTSNENQDSSKTKLNRIQTLTFNNSKYKPNDQPSRDTGRKRETDHSKSSNIRNIENRSARSRGGLINIHQTSKSSELQEEEHRKLQRAIRYDPTRVLDDPDLMPANKGKSSTNMEISDYQVLPHFFPISVNVTDKTNSENRFIIFDEYMKTILQDKYKEYCFFTFWNDDSDTIMQFATKEIRKKAVNAGINFTNQLQSCPKFTVEDFRRLWPIRMCQVTCYAFLVACFPNYAIEEQIDCFLFQEIFYRNIKQLENIGAKIEHDALTLTGVYTFRCIILTFKDLFKEKLPTSLNLNALLFRLYCYQGDLERYSQTFINTKNYSFSIKSYEMAAKILKYSGKPYHQMAVISFLQNDELTATYYYIRAVTIRHPFPGAQEKIMHMFHSIDSKMSAFRKLWTTKNVDIDSPGKLSKLVTLRILYICSRIYSRTSLEVISLQHSKMISDIKDMLSFQVLSDEHLFTKVLVIEAYIIANLSNNPENDKWKILALSLTFDVLRILCNFSSKLIEDEPICQTIISKNITPLLTSIKFHFDWIVSNSKLCLCDCQINLVELWHSLARFFNAINLIDKTNIEFFTEESQEFECKNIPNKNDLLDGCLLFCTSPFDEKLVKSITDENVAYIVLLLKKLENYGLFFLGLEPLVLDIDVNTNKFIAITKLENNVEDDVPVAEEDDVEIVLEKVDKEEDFNELEKREIEEEITHDVSQEIRELRAMRRQTYHQQQLKAKVKKETDEFFKRERKNFVKLVVKPCIILLDTNCFVHFFSKVQFLMENEKKRYKIVIPLIVIQELINLSKRLAESKASKSSSHALKYLKDVVFNISHRSKYLHVYALTASGSRLDRLDFMNDSSVDEKQNDDTILQCCLHYCMKSDELDKENRTGPKIIKRSLILLTDDINLRLKASALNIPAQQVSKFLKWYHN